MALSRLNQEQLNAATCPFGNNLVIASAGTGKTSTIVGRIAHLLSSGVEPSDILLLTFTNKAASEMIHRVAQYFNKDIATSIVSGTFHSVSFKLLKKLEFNITLKQPNELKTLFKSLYEKRYFNNRGDAPPYDGGYLYDQVSLYINSNNGESFTEWLIEKTPAQEIYCLIYEDIISEFTELKSRFGYVNFDDLLVLMLNTLQEKKVYFTEILVDEYQDTNPLQGRLLDSFAKKSLFCVGDYDQSIYAFNGSDISIISTFYKRYQNANIFTLTKNYRSCKPILDLANKVIENNERVYEKKLEVVRIEQSHRPTLLAFNELFDQYSFLAKNISASYTPKEEIAIIFRNNSSADGVEANLREYGIACKRKGGISFFEAREIKLFIDILTLLLNPNDMMAFIHIVEYGKGIGKAMGADLFEALLKLGNGNVIKGILDPVDDIHNPFTKPKHNVQLGLFDDDFTLGSVSKFKALHIEEKFLSNPILKHPKLTTSGAEFLYAFYKLIHDLKRIKVPANIIAHVMGSEIYKNVQEELARKRATQKDGSLNEEYYQESLTKIDRKVLLLKNLSQNYDTLHKFLNAMILGGGELSEGTGVNLLSIHASKGLEFKEVYLIDLMQGRFPNMRLVSKGGSVEEERRLFYVGVTRAKDILYLSYAKYDKVKKTDFVPSIFLHEAGLIKKD